MDENSDEEAVTGFEREGHPRGESGPEPTAVSDENPAGLDGSTEPVSWPRGSNHSLGPAIPDPDRIPQGPRSGESPAPPPWKPPRSRVDLAAEEAALTHVRAGRRTPALDVLRAAYGGPLTSFIVRVLRDTEDAKDVRQQVFVEALQDIGNFQGRGTLWGWLCGIAYHRCLDKLKQSRRARLATVSGGSELLDALAGEPDTTMDEDRVAKRRALERCLGRLSAPMRAQLMMRYFFGLSYQEIGALVGAPPGTVQVRMSRILPRLRSCLLGEGIVR